MPSLALDDFAELVLNGDGLLLFDDEPTSAYKDASLKIFQFLVAGFEFHLDDCLQNYISDNATKDQKRRLQENKKGHTRMAKLRRLGILLAT